MLKRRIILPTLRIKVRRPKIYDLVTAIAVLLLLIGIGMTVYVWRLQKDANVVNNPSVSVMYAINAERQAAIDAAKKQGKNTYTFITGKIPAPISQ